MPRAPPCRTSSCGAWACPASRAWSWAASATSTSRRARSCAASTPRPPSCSTARTSRAVELHHLVDARRLVGVLHRRQREGRERDLRGLLAPLGRIRAQALAQRLARRVQRRPQLLGAGRGLALAAVGEVVLAAHLAAELAAQVLVHVLVPAAVLAAGGRVVAAPEDLELLAQPGAETVAQPGVADPAPRRVQDDRAGVVDAAVEVGVDAAAARVVPALEDGGQLRGPLARRLGLAQHRLQRRPQLDRTHVLGRRRVGRGQHVGQRRLGVPRELVVEQVHALDAALVAEAVVAGREVLGRLVVPVDDVAAGRVDHLRVLLGGQLTGPLVFAAAVDRQVAVDARGAHGQRTRGVERRLAVAGVERVERLRRLLGGADEVGGAVHAAERHLLVEQLVDRLAAGTRALLGQRHELAGLLVGRVADHRAVDRAVEDRLGGLGALRDGAGVHRLHRLALALVGVLGLRAATELLGVGVDDVAAGRGQRPRVVRAAADEHVARERRRRHAAHVDARALHLDLHRQARVVEPDLRAAHEQRVAAGRLLARDDEDVAGLVALAGRRGVRLGRRGLGAGQPDEGVAERAALEADQALGVADADLGQRLGAAGRVGRLRIVAAAQVLEGGVAVLLTELGAQAVEEQRVGDLVAAALAEELGLDRVQGVDVGPRERRRRRLGGRHARVDAGQVGVDVVEQLLALGALGLDALGLLRGDLVDDLLAGLVVVQPEDEVDRRDAGQVDQAGDAVGTGLVHEQRLVGGDRVAGAEDGAGVGVAVDVRHAVRVALDRGADRAGGRRGARHRLGADEGRVVLGQEGGRLVVAAAVGAGHERLLGDVPEQGRDPVIHLGLGVGRQDAGRRRPRDPGGHLAVGDDVERGVGGGRRGEGGREGDRGVEKSTSMGHAARVLDTLSKLRRAVRTSANVPSLRNVTASLRQKQDVTPDLTERQPPPAFAPAAAPEAERFRAAYTEHHEAIWRYFVRRLHDDELAQDLTSEVFLVAWRRRREASTGELSWLYAVARRVLANDRRAARAREARDRALAGELATAASAERQAAADDGAAVAAALAALPGRDREILLLATWEDLSTAQLATALGCLPATARVPLHRARRRFAALLDPRPSDQGPTT